MQTVPVQMAQPSRGAQTTETQIEVQWTTLTSDSDVGGAVVTSYWLEWDAGSSQATWQDLAGRTSSYTNTSFIVTTGVSAGQTYAFRVSAMNAHGAGPSSAVRTIVASAAPSQMAAPTTAINAGTDIRVSWTAADANSDALSAYTVWI